MNLAQLDDLLEIEKANQPIFLSQQDYTHKGMADSKTLLYGYDCDRNTWHVFQDSDGSIKLYVYRILDTVKEIKAINVTTDGIYALSELIPNKRLYPQYCDYEFCEFLKGKGVHLPFTTFQEPHPYDGVFVGETF